MFSNAVPEPDWWTININTELVANENGVNQLHQFSPFASAGVSLEIPSSNETGSPSIEAAFQTTCQSFGSCQESFELDFQANPEVCFEQKAPLAYPDDDYSKVIRD